MQRFAVGVVCNIAIVFAGYALIALLGVLPTHTLPEFFQEAELDFWLQVLWAPIMAIFALLGAFAHARLTPRRFLGQTAGATVAAALALLVVVSLNFPYVRANLDDPFAVGTLVGAGAIGAIIGGILGAVTHHESG